FRELLADVRAGDLAAFANADVPFERLVQHLDPPRSTAHHPIFQSTLSLQNFVDPVLELPGLRIAVEDLDRDATQFDLALDLRERTENGEPAGLEAVLTYATDLFDPATPEAVARRWTALLDAALAARVGDLDLLLPEERHLVPARGPRSRETVTLPELLATTAAAHPDRPAVVADGHTLTYRELDRRAARLAARLAGAGAGRETVVAL